MTATGQHSDDVVERARSGLREAFGDGPHEHVDPVVALAPGRVNLVGGHTDYNDGLCLPKAIDRHVAVAAEPREDDRIRVYATDFDETATFAPGDGPTGWAAYVAAVVGVLREDRAIPGANLAIASNVPSGAGLSSSAAIELAVGKAMVELSGTVLSKTDLALACWRAEREGVGVECGILDQFAVGLCKPDTALFLDCRTRAFEHVPIAGDVGILVVDTGVSHELADSGYNDRVRECEAAVTALRSATETEIRSLRDVEEDVLETHADALDDVHYRRARHVVTENERVVSGRDALVAGEFDRVGAAMLASHESLRDDYEVSCAELDAAVELAAETPGVYGARMTGGGFGGSVVALVAGDALERAEQSIRAEVSGQVGPNAQVFACRPSEGVRIVTPE
ncbi:MULTISPECIES: galactokinase [Haloferax]|uniref:Galactokinase n=1 Tax=Haloferax marinum TaxID=2666143 RepID=A0A6A8G2C5_9EURY|nr:MULTISPECIES: galactokinase [Haloferax]KAB1196295.1 galactokinase [Haloferax sp. CBA1150]MRW95284.1 galactokinase [Haloferax marinum]